MTILRYCNFQRFTQKHLLHTAYVISPTTRAQEQENQACFLTKTIVQNKLPETYQNAVRIPPEERENIVEAVKKCIIETNYFHRDEALDLPKRWSSHRKAWNMEEWKSGLSHHVMLNMLKVIWSTKSGRNSSVISRTLSYRPDLVAPWLRLGKKIQVSGKHGHLINGKGLLPLFACNEEILHTCNDVISWEDIISPFFDLHEYSSTFEANRGFHDGSPYFCPQTLLLVNPVAWKDRFNFGQGVFFSFAHAMTYALSQGEEMGKDLINPVPIQCIIFNGRSFFFICYQLNTLNFSDDNEGIKNMAWIIDHRLYDKVTDQLSESEDFIEYTSQRVSLVDFNRKQISETFTDQKTLKVSIEGFNRNPVDIFIDFLLY